MLAAHAKRWNRAGAGALLTAFAMTVPTLVTLLAAGAGAPAVWVRNAMASLRQGPDDFSSVYTRAAPDRLHGGLLVEGFDQESCRSRYQSATYRRNPGRRPSGHLVSKLRRHLQRRCGPGTAAYRDALEYLVSLSYRGLGNRILAAASAFLYALLTGRALLVDPSNEMDALLCEPFPNTTWLPPPGFPLWSFNLDTPERHSKMRESGVLRPDMVAADTPAAFAYVHLDYNQTDHDRLFFCDQDQRLLSSFQWLVMRTAWYYEPVKGMYWEHAAAGGEVVVVSQPSHEEYQHYGVRSHEYKVWAEIFLLSLTDMLVTTGKSTFGYVAQRLAGMRPWVLLLNQANGTAGHGPPCSRDVSMEPCFHVAPPYDCKRRRDSGEIVPHVRHCEDLPTGLKLVDRKEW
ncbi:hypothetical protein C2845_PM09G06570 [Panicum miliaceum]|uniref:Fucosyltransferase n=1 Tax=Panicum miliaceum TaxID=4540 RepID=A0A3L6RXW0_PANMI|nr:hypothetical protein C2845_PM09G06570 [Panicum miliaceum]